MTDIEKKDWLKESKAILKISKEYFHHHAFEILNTHRTVKRNLEKSLNSDIGIIPRIKKSGQKNSRAIEATNLNKEIRKLLNKYPNNEIKFEVNEDKGVFYFKAEKSSIGGFDFAILNQYKNINALRNLCFGEIHFHEGEKKWESFLIKNPELREISKKLKQIENIGQNTNIEESISTEITPIIVGEIQFGNWALAYRDFFKVLKANVQNSVDCLIYIVPTGQLEEMLSDGIVTFDNAKKIILDFAKVISVPIWLVGIDFENNEK